MNTTKTIELIVEILKTFGIKHTLFFLLTIIFFILLFQFFKKGINWFFSRKEISLKLEKEKNITDLQHIYFRNTDKFIEKITENNEINSTILEKLQITISNQKFNLLIEAFIGLNRDFLSAIKAKLIGYIELENQENFAFIKNEIKNLFIEKVISRINFFIIYDEKLLENIKKESFDILDNFLNEFQKLINLKDKKELKKYIRSETGLYTSINNLYSLILKKYKDITINSKNFSYLRDIEK